MRNRDFVETNATSQNRLESLKNELRAGPIPVARDSAVWNSRLYDRVNRAPGKLEGLEFFGFQVEEWIWESIRE